MGTKPLPELPPESAELPSCDEVWHWIKQLNAFGPRLTGSEAQAQAVDFIAAKLREFKLEVQRDTHTLCRWTPGRTALSLAGGGDIAVAAPYPYSGRTPPEGVTGELFWLGTSRRFDRARGKIAVVEIKPWRLRRWLVGLLVDKKSCRPDCSADFEPSERTALLGPLIDLPLKKARKAGVLGVVCIMAGQSAAQARGQVLPFTTPYEDCPAVWVDAREGARLEEAARRGTTATLVLEAELIKTKTDTVYAVLPGSNPNETIIVNTHTDGPNACEENGAAGLLALARYHTQRDISVRRRSIAFVFVTGHFQMPQIVCSGHDQATMTWLKAHRKLWDGGPGNARAVAGLTLEHLGCTEWKDNAASGPAPSGRLERELVYTTNGMMERIYQKAIEGRTKWRSLTVAPRTKLVFFGEAQPLFAKRIPSISLIPLPDYLCQILPGGGIERLDAEFAFQQIATFNTALRYLDALPTADIGRVPWMPF